MIIMIEREEAQMRIILMSIRQFILFDVFNWQLFHLLNSMYFNFHGIQIEGPLNIKCFLSIKLSQSVDLKGVDNLRIISRVKREASHKRLNLTQHRALNNQNINIDPQLLVDSLNNAQCHIFLIFHEKVQLLNCPEIMSIRKLHVVTSDQ